MKKSIHFLFVCIFILFNGNYNRIYCQVCDPISDSIELVKFYYSLNGDEWNNNDGWLIQPVRNWFGTIIDLQGCVTGIYMNNNNLEGILPNMNLPHLSTMKLSNNRITGRIPSFSNMMQKLTYLDLSNNFLVGPIDFQTFPLSGNPSFPPIISYLNLSSNGLEGNFSPPGSPNYQDSLILSRNQFESVDFQGTRFNTVDVSENMIKSDIIGGINISCQNVDMSHNRLTVFPFGSIQLMRYDVSHNSIENDIDSVWQLTSSSTPNMRYFDIGYNRQSGVLGPQFFEGYQSGMLDFIANNNYFTELRLPPSSNVGIINLNDNQINRPIVDTAHYVKLLLGNNNLSFTDLINSKFLGQYVEYSDQNKFHRDTIYDLPRISQINLGIDSLVSGCFYKWYRNDTLISLPFPGLSILGTNLMFENIDTSIWSSDDYNASGIYRCVITNPDSFPLIELESHPFLVSLCNPQMDSLELLKLFELNNGDNWNNKSNWLVSGMPIGSWFGITTNSSGCVTDIQLNNNNMTGNVTIKNLPHLRTFNLHGNSLTGNLPELNTPNLRVFDLSDNQFSGAFPDRMTSWYEVTSINLKNNQLSGPIPPDIGDLCELISLDLSNNQIVGLLPNSFIMLEKLTAHNVNLSNNLIESVGDSCIWLCVLEPSFLYGNSAYDSINYICSGQCDGYEFTDPSVIPWLTDTLLNNDDYCQINPSRKSVGGFIDIRGSRLIFLKTKEANFYGDGKFRDVIKIFSRDGILLEKIMYSESIGYQGNRWITQEDLANATYDIKWKCGRYSSVSFPLEDPFVSGIVSTEANQKIENVIVNVRGNVNLVNTFNLNSITDSLGNYYVLDTLIAGYNISFLPHKYDSPTNGLTTYDLVLISKHILGITPLGSPFKIIAADANNSGSVTTTDIVELRKLILGIQNDFTNNNPWRFFYKSQVFNDSQNPFKDDLLEMSPPIFLSTAINDINFTGVKIGDVNGTAVTNSRPVPDDRTTDTLFLDCKDRYVRQGEVFSIQFSTSEKAFSYQSTMELDGLEIQEIPQQTEADIHNFGVFQDAISFSMDGADSFSLTLRALKSGMLSDLTGLSGRITSTEAYSADQTKMNLALRFHDADDPLTPSVIAPEFRLFGCQPNPWQNTSNISFEIPDPGKVSLDIFDAEGRVILMREDNFPAGVNRFFLDSKSVPNDGILYYRVETSTGIKGGLIFKNSTSN